MVEAIGLTASVLLSVSAIPQIVKSLRTKRAEDLSLAMIVLFLVGFALWIVYGWLIRSVPVIITNTVSLGSMLVALYLKRRYG
jgi:MtN3 and saliva related transmembrane protein